MKELIPFLEQLAFKLGTTTEKIWVVLLKQAPISAMVDIVCWIFFLLIGIFGIEATRLAIEIYKIIYGD